MHIPPRFVAGRPTTLQLELSSWRSGFRPLSRRYRAVQCHYRPTTQSAYVAVPMELLPNRGDRRHIFYHCTLPPFPAGAEVEYYFDLRFDGVYNRRALETVSVQAPPTL